MQSVASRIWTRVVVSISYDDNHYTTGTSTIGPYQFLTTPAQSGIEADANKRLQHNSQSSSISEASPEDCLVTYSGYSLGESYSSVEMRSVYSAASADWAKRTYAKLNRLNRTVLSFNCINKWLLFNWIDSDT